MVSFSLGEDHRQKSELAYELLTARAKREQQRTVNGVDDESLAHGVLVLRRGVAAVVADLVATNVANRLDLVRLYERCG